MSFGDEECEPPPPKARSKRERKKPRRKALLLIGETLLAALGGGICGWALHRPPPPDPPLPSYCAALRDQPIGGMHICPTTTEGVHCYEWSRSIREVFKASLCSEPPDGAGGTSL